MRETAEDMMRFTRKELEKKAHACGIDATSRKKYPGKMDIARDILKRSEPKHEKEIPAKTAHAPKAPARAPARFVTSGKKGVYAIRTAINGQVIENEEASARLGMAVRDFQGDMAGKARHIRAGSDQMCKDIAGLRVSIDSRVKDVFDNVRELQKNIGEQSRKNAKAAGDMGASVRAFQGEIGARRSDMGKHCADFRRDVGSFQADMDAFNANVNANVREMRDGIMEFRDMTANYIKDFYFG
jgi:hypothetical protein